jgi:hypothetical protein
MHVLFMGVREASSEKATFEGAEDNLNKKSVMEKLFRSCDRQGTFQTEG